MGNGVHDELIRKQDAIKAICEDGTWLESQGCTEITMAERKQRDADILSELPPANTDLIRKIEEGIKATGTADVYSVGMCNGMKWCISLIDGKEPLYENCPSTQSDVPDTNAGDMISRKAAIYVASGYCHPSNVAKELAKLPSVHPKQGEWEYHSNPTIGINPETAYCSCCGLRVDTTGDIDFDEYNFCPRCGADMRCSENPNS